jgi:hypothetical protein
MYMQYIVETADPRAPGYFVRETGDRAWQFERDHRLALKMSLQTAKDFVKILAMKGVIGRVCDQHANPQTDYVYAGTKTEELTLHNSHTQFTYRNRGIEIPVVHALHLNKFYFRFTNNPMDPNAPIDQSIAADSASDLIDHFLDNPAISQVIKDRFKVDTAFLQQPPADPAVPEGTPSISIELGKYGTTIVGVRPGSVSRH